MTQKFHEPFSPTILETTVPYSFVRIVNKVSDDILSNDSKSEKWDWSHKLVGKVNKEILIPVTDEDDREFLFEIMKQGCLDYLNYMIEHKRNNPWTRLATEQSQLWLTFTLLKVGWLVSMQEILIPFTTTTETSLVVSISRCQKV